MNFRIEIPGHDPETDTPDESTIIDELRDTIESLGLKTGYVTKLGVHRDDWEKGQPCPECGSTEIKAIYVGSDICHSENGDWEYLQSGPYDDNNIRYDCENCRTRLEANAPADLME